MKTNGMFRKMAVAAMALCLAAPGLSTASAAGGEDAYDIVSLGDSISVGYEPGLTEKSVPYGYVERVYEQALFHGRSELANYAILGLTTPGLINLLKGAAEGKTLKATDLQDFSSYNDPRISQFAESMAAKSAEIAPALSKADLVVLTVGGNDFGDFIKAMVAQPTEDAKKTLQNNFDGIMNKYTADLDTMVRQLRLLAPNAKIVLADQYLPLPSWHPLYEDLKAAIVKLSAQLDGLAEKLNAEGIPLQIAHVSDSFVGNETTYTYIVLKDNHPQQAGYESMAKTFSDLLWHEYRKPSPRAADVPLTIVLNGDELKTKTKLDKKTNTNFLPLREFANAVKADLEWKQATQTAIFSKDGRKVSITIGAKTMLVNGVSQPLDTPAYFEKTGKNGTLTYVPLSVIVKGLGYEVVFRKNLQTAFIYN